MVKSRHPRDIQLKCPAAMALALLLVGTSGSVLEAAPVAAAKARFTAVPAVAAENEYGNVIAQVGGPFVKVSSLIDNPDADPHSFELSPGALATVASARLIVQNGLGYDTFMNRIESASASSGRHVIVVAHLLGLGEQTPNPHLWYKPATMTLVATAVAVALGKIDPAHGGYFDANLARFKASQRPWLRAVATFRSNHGGTPVATTEPIADYLLQAMDAQIRTPERLELDVMNGIDPPPQDTALEQQLLTGHEVKVFVYNRQVVDSLTETFLRTARSSGVPVVGVDETMPTPGYTYQRWMLATVQNIERAVTSHEGPR
ncbi:MAG: metal ABC transporter solute-binding protein, Zn/Mn family [Acidimicrobiales bacterium]